MPSVREQYSRKIIEEYQLPYESIPDIPSLPTPLVLSDASDVDTLRQQEGIKRPEVTIGVIGAGAAGLYIGMTLEKVNAYLTNAGLEPIKYEILEAESGPHNIGGRLWTHRFSKSANDYYDRGAMRFPDHPPMKPVMDLFNELGLQKSKIPYVMSTDANINLFNSLNQTNAEVQAKAQAGNFDPFGTLVKGLTGTVTDMVNDQIDHFKQALVDDFDKGWEKLMKYDAWSARGYMTIEGAPKIGPYSGRVVDYLETFAVGSGMYNQALSETVIDSLDFEYPTKFNWWAIQGGSSVIAEAMAKRIPAGHIFNGARVTALAPAIELASPHDSLRPVPTPTLTGVNVYVHGESKPRKYSHVVTTLPFGALRMVDTTACNLSWDLQSAIRSLSYDGSTKIGIKFKTRWWEKLTPPQKGGVSYTDRPTRVVVYPSYGIGGSDATITVSYTWAQDALRQGSFASTKENQRILLDAVLRDLTDIHGIDSYDYLPSQMDSCDIWAWYNYENTVGAYALFGPGQFSGLYNEVTQPAIEGRLHFAGEATSVWHAWVLGAIMSAKRVLREIFIQEITKQIFGRRSGTLFDEIEKLFEFSELDDRLLKNQIALGIDRKLDLAQSAKLSAKFSEQIAS